MKYRRQFEILHAKIATFIKEVYKLIVKTQLAFASLMFPLQLASEPPPKEKTKIPLEKYDELTTYF